MGDMASTSSEQTVKDFLECPICFMQYDEGSHRPKFLPCHHTLCLNCINEMISQSGAESADEGARLLCPICRKACKFSGSTLTDNAYILQMLKMHQEASSPTSTLSRVTVNDIQNLSKEMNDRRKLSHHYLMQAHALRVEAKNYLGRIKDDAGKIFSKLCSLYRENELDLAKLNNQLAQLSTPTSIGEANWTALIKESAPDDTLKGLESKSLISLTESIKKLREVERDVGWVKPRFEGNQFKALSLTINGQQVETLKSDLMHHLAFELIEQKETKPTVTLGTPEMRVLEVKGTINGEVRRILLARRSQDGKINF